MRARGFTLIELTVVLTIATLIVVAAVPRFRVAMETTRVDMCAGRLYSIWNAQRIYFLEQQTYASSLQDLVDAGALDAAVADATDPFSYALLSAGDAAFTVDATRAGTLWSGTLSINELGAVTGYVGDTEGKRVDAPAK